MIEMQRGNIIFDYGGPDENHALKDISLKVERGDYITIIGSNGAGKSTLFNAIGGSYPLHSGTVSFDGKDITGRPEFKRAAFIGRIFQNPLMGTAGNMSLEDNMALAVEKGMKKLKYTLNAQRRHEFRLRLHELDMGLEERLKDSVGLFSGGQRQALTLLMAVLSHPELLLLDEHTAALDPRNAAKVMELTDHFITHYRLTVMMITHNMQMAINHGNRLLMMDRGEIILDVSGEEKKLLTVEKLVDAFHRIRHADYTTDEDLLN